MKLVASFVAVAMATCSVSAQEVVSEWNDQYLDILRNTAGGPGFMSRSGAMMHGAIFDALNTVDHRHVGYAYNQTAPAGTDRSAAMATAAHTVLSNIYANDAGVIAQINSLYNTQMAAIPGGAAKAQGIAVGSSVGQAWNAARANDGWDATVDYTPGDQPGDWRPVGPNYGGPVSPQWGNVTPFTMAGGNQFLPPLPPAINSTEYTAAYNQVRELGALNSATRTAEQTDIAWFWGMDRAGTYHPPGHLNAITRQIVEQTFPSMNLTPEEWQYQEARLLALTNIAMADAGIAAWDCKYNTDADLWRPTTGIQEGDFDGNPDTVGDPNWEPLSAEVRIIDGVEHEGYVPGFPAYISGHATFGAAHAAVMAAFFGTDDLTFTISSEEPFYTGGDRTFDSFTDAALENGISRVYLGVHWIFDSEQGYIVGADVGQWAFSHAWQLIPAPGGVGLLAFAGLAVARRRRAC